MTYGNPRLLAEFNDWPSGRNRVKCRFEAQAGKNGAFRVARTTTDQHGRWCKPKLTTFGGQLAIVDGDDGRTYIVQYASYPHEFINVWRSDFMHEGAVWPKDETLYAELSALIAEANAPQRATA